MFDVCLLFDEVDDWCLEWLMLLLCSINRLMDESMVRWSRNGVCIVDMMALVVVWWMFDDGLMIDCCWKVLCLLMGLDGLMLMFVGWCKVVGGMVEGEYKVWLMCLVDCDGWWWCLMMKNESSFVCLMNVGYFVVIDWHVSWCLMFDECLLLDGRMKYISEVLGDWWWF